MVEQVIPWALSFWALFNMWLAGNKNILAWYSGLAAQGLWGIYGFVAHAYGFIPMCFIFSIVYYRNICRWRN